ncbi:uncharacterized protein J7T54_008343 [Emericellopsis cladophorae]|uniref:Capsule polysaccharide biosynthesis protein n=1 Tax=Emericellopsis cladophorae TaxID=2686198 RepID=A0A9Q0BEB0_9HYPO|nr:uncharacterized protein J7T54_008343 [Emericellopsis cladophorae]KAI6782257.1 hypothetical protein J7T54_008343 [Emericellopsis cladophorae]
MWLIPFLGDLLAAHPWLLTLCLLAVLNAKVLPGAWTLRVLWQYNVSYYASRRRTRPAPLPTNPDRRVASWHHGPGSSTGSHPLFQADRIRSHVALLEIDINLHKSNATFFTDLDVSRIRLMARLMAPAWPMDKMQIEYTGRDGQPRRETVRGRAAFILGSAHTTFRKEMRALARYEVHSALLAWDTRWLYVGSWFVAPGQSTTIYAASLSKYILKKGRITVAPSQFLEEGGWIPPAHADDDEQHGARSRAWSWQNAETQRARGMETVRGWASVDDGLVKAYASVCHGE